MPPEAMSYTVRIWVSKDTTYSEDDSPWEGSNTNETCDRVRFAVQANYIDSVADHSYKEWIKKYITMDSINKTAMMNVHRVQTTQVKTSRYWKAFGKAIQQQLMPADTADEESRVMGKSRQKAMREKRKLKSKK